jgi:hypothetical protein
LDSATQRAEQAEGLVEQARGELAAERDRHDVSLADLHDQLAQLLARRPVDTGGMRPGAPKRASPRKGSAPATEPEPAS